MNSNNLIIELLKNKKVKDFCIKNSMSEDEILHNYSALSQYNDMMKCCSACEGKTCTSQIDGLTCHLELSRNRIVNVIYDDCIKNKSMDPGNLEVIDYYGKEIDIELSSARNKLFLLLNKFSDEYFDTGYSKGIYLCGKCGVGKSLLLYMFAKTMVSKGAKVVFAYYPDLVRQFQTSFGTANSEALIYKLKTIDILIIDDIGRESNTSYIRDEILGPILQYRCDNRLPMFMTSNRSFRLLETHLSETNTVTDTVKGKAVMERIKYLMKEYELDDKDYRNN